MCATHDYVNVLFGVAGYCPTVELVAWRIPKGATVSVLAK